MSDRALIKQLTAVEAWADGLKEQCRKARKLIEGGVSTPAKRQRGLSKKQLAEVSARRRRHILKNCL